MIRTLVAGGVAVIALPLSMATAPLASADTASQQAVHASTRGTITTTDSKVAPSTSDKSRTTAARSSAPIYSVPKSFVSKREKKCRRTFPHNLRLRTICVSVQSHLAKAAKWKVNLHRADVQWHAYKSDHRLARKCRHHHKWCAHAKKLRGLTISKCGPLPPPTWKFRATCLSNLAGQHKSNYLHYTLFTTSTLSPKDVRMIKKAVKAMGPKDNTRVSVSHGLSFWKGPYVNVVIKRSQTEQVYQKTRDISNMTVVGTMICAIVGAATADLVTPLCTGALVLALNDAKDMSAKAHNEGRCLALRIYALSAVVVQGISNPLAVSDCVTSKAALNRTLNRAERRAS